MNLDFLSKYYVPIVVVACLIIGYCMKRFKGIPDKIIPTVLAIIGAVLACVNAKEVTLQNIVYGAFSGLASTGLHQMFKQYIKDDDKKEGEENGSAE